MAARNALSRTLKADGRRGDAASITALRRPSWTDWALNRAADAEPDLGAAFADAAATMREAQDAAVEGRQADVAGALRTLRERTAALAKRANAELTSSGRPTDIAALTERLAAVAADEVVSTQLRAAGLRSGDDTDDTDGAIAGLPDTPTSRRVTPVTEHPKSARTARGAKRAPAAGADDVAAEPPADRAVERAAERRRVTREVADLERAQRAVAHELTRVRRSVHDATSQRDSAQKAVARAHEELEEAARRLAAVSDRQVALELDVADAEQRAAALRSELDALATDP